MTPIEPSDIVPNAYYCIRTGKYGQFICDSIFEIGIGIGPHADKVHPMSCGGRAVLSLCFLMQEDATLKCGLFWSDEGVWERHDNHILTDLNSFFKLAKHAADNDMT